MGSKTTTEQSMPQFQEDFLKNEILPTATDIANREFTQYGGERVAGMTPLQQRAMSGYENLQAGTEQYGQAADIYSDMAQAQTDVSAYMNPYQQNVIDASLRTLGGAQEQALNMQGAQASAAGAFGGSRHGVAEAETRKAYGQQASDLVTNQMQAGYQNAQAAAQNDMSRRMNAAAGLTQTAGQNLEAQKAVLGAQMQAGETSRGLNQQGLDVGYADFMAEQNFPLTGFNALLGAASGIPTGYGTTTQTQSGFGNYLDAAGSFGMGMGPQGFGIFK
jgi:hypothetical protein